MKTKLYIFGPENWCEGPYWLLSEHGEGLACHYCSHKGFARRDLDRPERQKEWKNKFGEYEILFIGDDELTRDEILKRNHNFKE